MRLYRTSAGQWLGTQDAARAAAKAAGGTFELVEVPDTKAELLAWLNAGGAPASQPSPPTARAELAELDQANEPAEPTAGNFPRAWLLDWQRDMRARGLALDLDVALTAALEAAPLEAARRYAATAADRVRELEA